MESLTSFASAFIGNESDISARGGPLTLALVWPLIATHSVLCLSVVSPCRRIEYSQSSWFAIIYSQMPEIYLYMGFLSLLL